MSKVVKLALIRAQHDSSAAGLSDGDVRQMFFANADNSSVFQFWNQGFFDLSQSTLIAKTIDFTVDFAKADSRSALASEVFDKLAATGENLSAYDGYVFLVSPGGDVTVSNPAAGQPGQPNTITRTIDGGTSNFSNGKSFCVLPVGSSDHMFFCHEVGHVSGMEHTFGLLNNGIDWNGVGATGNVYGDPYDIMSSATFGSRGSGPIRWNADPTFAGNPVSWPNAAAFTMGCAPARANVHFLNTAHFPSGEISAMSMPTGGLQHTRRLFRASGGAGNTQLLVVHPPNEGSDGVGRCYIEYRDRAGWDRGLDTAGTDLDRRAVVIHTVAPSSDGARVWYRGNILVPLEVDADFSTPDVPVTVTLLNTAADFDYVDVSISTRLAKGMTVVHYEEDEEVEAIGETVQTNIPCGRVRYGTYRMRHTSRFDLSIYGYGDPAAPDAPASRPVIRWVLGGSALPAGPSSGSVNVSKAGGGMASVNYDLTRAGVLTVVVGPSQGAFKTSVSCTVTEADGSSPNSQLLELEALGEYTGVRRLDRALLNECMRHVMARVRLRKKDLLIPPGPNPYRDRIADRENLARLRLISNSLQESERWVSQDLRRLGALLYAREFVG